jgi:DNA topoisomerase IB
VDLPGPDGHLQAVGWDMRGRKQYRYHPRWRKVRDAGKHGKLLVFGKGLPKIRERVEEDLARRGLSREKVLAVIVQLLEATMMRVGNEGRGGVEVAGQHAGHLPQVLHSPGDFSTGILMDRYARL